MNIVQGAIRLPDKNGPSTRPLDYGYETTRDVAIGIIGDITRICKMVEEDQNNHD